LVYSNGLHALAKRVATLHDELTRLRETQPENEDLASENVRHQRSVSAMLLDAETRFDQAVKALETIGFSCGSSDWRLYANSRPVLSVKQQDYDSGTSRSKAV
jgi:predicted  nucleic acid-binding Zn-ribbon protein